MITEHQYRRLMKEYQQSGQVGRAALKASMDRKTAARYLAAGHGPEVKESRWWRTRSDPLQAVWPEAERWLGRAPELETKALFEHLVATRPEEISARAHRSFYRRVARWKREHGAPREVFFPQARTPGASLQLDWTHASELAVKIGGEAFPHLLCHAVLPYSNWEWAVPCRSESFLSLKAGLSAALWELGGVPGQLQTDQSSTATHAVRRAARERGFNPEYLALCAHHGIEPRTINRASPQENGDVESANGHLKRRLEAHLVLRGERDFAHEADYAAFVAQVCRGANALRRERLAEELAVLRPLPATRYPEAEEILLTLVSTSVRVFLGWAPIRLFVHGFPACIKSFRKPLVFDHEKYLLSSERLVLLLIRSELGQPFITNILGYFLGLQENQLSVYRPVLETIFTAVSVFCSAFNLRLTTGRDSAAAGRI